MLSDKEARRMEDYQMLLNRRDFQIWTYGPCRNCYARHKCYAFVQKARTIQNAVRAFCEHF